MLYRRLNASQIVATVRTLRQRIAERFPESSLTRVSGELLDAATEAAERAASLGRPNRPLRIAIAVLIVVVVAALLTAIGTLRLPAGIRGIGELAQAVEAMINNVVFFGIAIFFLSTVETRLKRDRALRAIHELRSLAHIVDMHQLTKDPEQFLSDKADTPSSPKRTMTRFELTRYLDYCSELLSLTGKIAALYAQNFRDPVVLDSVNDVEQLTNGISRKIWQKIMVLEAVMPGARGGAGA